VIEYEELIGSNGHHDANFEGQHQTGDKGQHTRHQIGTCKSKIQRIFISGKSFL